MTNKAKLAGKLADDLPKLSNIWAVKLEIPLKNRNYILFDAMGPFIYYRRYEYEPIILMLFLKYQKKFTGQVPCL